MVVDEAEAVTTERPREALTATLWKSECVKAENEEGHKLAVDARISLAHEEWIRRGFECTENAMALALWLCVCSSMGNRTPSLSLDWTVDCRVEREKDVSVRKLTRLVPKQ